MFFTLQQFSNGKLILYFIADYVKARKPPVVLRAGEVHAVVVVPEGGRPLFVGVGVVLGTPVEAPCRIA